ncbi:MAG: hypothetical protein GKR95_15380 [Gammaproteobacteria bacterium]|nr:hypothetical protein [Gammaproteobacteria bacterium]
MKISGQHRLSMHYRAVWSSLNDPDVLQRCIKSCDSVERIDVDHFLLKFTIRIGLLRKKLVADVRVIESDLPQYYSLIVEVDAGLAGKVSGQTEVELVDEGEHTQLNYDANIQLSGWLGRLDLPFLKDTARRQMHRFIENLVLVSVEKEIVNDEA